VKRSCIQRLPRCADAHGPVLRVIRGSHIRGHFVELHIRNPGLPRAVEQNTRGDQLALSGTSSTAVYGVQSTVPLISRSPMLCALATPRPRPRGSASPPKSTGSDIASPVGECRSTCDSQSALGLRLLAFAAGPGQAAVNRTIDLLMRGRDRRHIAGRARSPLRAVNPSGHRKPRRAEDCAPYRRVVVHLSDSSVCWSTATFWYEPVPSAPLPTFPELEARVSDAWRN